MSPDLRPKSFGTFEKQAPETLLLVSPQQPAQDILPKTIWLASLKDTKDSFSIWQADLERPFETLKDRKLCSSCPLRKAQLLNRQQEKKLPFVLATQVLNKNHKRLNMKPASHAQQLDENDYLMGRDSSKKNATL